jgi:hypothetical protein
MLARHYTQDALAVKSGVYQKDLRNDPRERIQGTGDWTVHLVEPCAL